MRLNSAWMLGCLFFVFSAFRLVALTDGNDITDPYEGYADDGWWKISREVVTQHTAWAKPYAEGALKVLLITPFANARTLVELEQRFDFHCDIFMTTDYDCIYAANDNWTQRPYLRKFKDAEAKALKPGDYDVILIGGQQWISLPFDLQYNILEAVAKKGVGLVYINPWGPADKAKDRDPILQQVFRQAESDNGYICRGIPWEDLSFVQGEIKDAKRQKKEWKLEDFIQTYVLKKGRVAAFLYKPSYRNCLAPEKEQDIWSGPELHYDIYAAMLGRAILWAAQKDPAVKIVKSSFDEKTIPQDRKGPFTINVKNNGKPLSCSINVRVRVNDYRFCEFIGEATVKADIPAGESTINIPCPHMPAGEVLVDVFVKADNKVLDWSTRIITVNRSSRKIASIEEPDVINGSDAVVPLTIKMDGAPTDGLKLTAEMSDIYGRLLVKSEQEVKGQDSIRLDVPLSRVKGNQMWVKLKLTHGNIIEQILFRRVYRADTSLPDFLVGAWLGGFYVNDNALWTHNTYQQIKKIGINGAAMPMVFWQYNIDRKQRGVMGTDAGLKLIPFVNRLTFEHRKMSPDGLECLECFTNTEADKGRVETFEKLVQDFSRFGSVFYNLGDENCLFFVRESDACRCHYCLAGFKKALKDEYSDLSALNKEWGSDFKNWDDIMPDILSQAKARGQFASWSDFRAYMESTLANTHKTHLEKIRSIAGPEARTYINGLSDFRSCTGLDWTKLCPNVTLPVPYDKNTSLSMARDLSPKGSIFGANSGVYSSRPDTQWSGTGAYPWSMLGRGGRFMTFWNTYTGEITWTSAVMPDLRPTTQLKWLGESVRQVNGGPARLIMQSERRYDPVAILYSRTSIRASSLNAGLGTSYGSMDVLSCNAAYLLGITPRFISDEQILDANFMKQFKVLVLPNSQALSDKTAKAIEAFAQAGGTVIADVRPGVFTGHMAGREKGVLDTLFGVVQTSGIKPVEELVTADWIDPMAGEKIKTDEIMADSTISGTAKKKDREAALKSDGALQLADGKAGFVLPESKVPVLIEKKHGSGRAILLNIQNSPKLMPLWKKLFAESGVQTHITATDDKGVEATGFRRDTFVSGPAEYCFLFEGPKMEATVKLPKKAHVYEVREGKYLGFTDTITRNLELPWMLALLPAKTTGLSVSAPGQIIAGQDLKGEFKMTFSEGPAFTHVVRVDIYDPNGKWLEHYRTLVETSDGSGTFSIPLSINEKPGQYKMLVTDAATAVQGTGNVLVKSTEK